MVVECRCARDCDNTVDRKAAKCSCVDGSVARTSATAVSRRSKLSGESGGLRSSDESLPHITSGSISRIAAWMTKLSVEDKKKVKSRGILVRF